MATERAGHSRPRKSRHGLVPLSAGEIELYAGRDEAARRRQRLLDVRDRERRIAQQVTRRYRENLDRLRGKKVRGAQLELTLQHEVLLSELHQRYRLSLQSMGTAHRNARKKLLELLEQANDEALKWQFNEHVVAKHRSGEAIRSHDEEERERLARRWEVEQNLMRLRDLATKQRAEASEHAKKEREAQTQRVKETEEAERVRRENMAEEVVTMPRPHANDVVSYHFTRLHCLSTDPATAGPTRTNVKVVRHNTRHPSAKCGVEEAVKYREEVDKRLEQRRRENEENSETANTRGADAMDVVASRKGGEKAMEWLASIDKSDRKELSPESITDADAHAVSRLRRTPESARDKEFARMFRINEEDSGELSVFSAGSEQELDEEEMSPVRSTGDEMERVKLKARASFSFDVQKPSAQPEPQSDQPISNDSEEESEGDARIELLKDFLEATTKMKQRGKTGGAPTPGENAQGSPEYSWQPTGKRYTGHGSSRSTPRHRDRPRDEGFNAANAKPSTAATIGMPLEQQRPSDRAAKAADSQMEMAVEPPAPPIGQREERLPDSDDGYTEQDSIELLEDRLQEVLNLRLRRARYSHSLSSSSDEGSQSETSEARQPAAIGSPPHGPIDAYSDRVRRARRSSAGSSIAQYSLPPSDLHSSFDDTIGDIQRGDDSFVNELVPMFPNPGAQRQQLALRDSEGGVLAQYDLPPDDPALRRMSPSSSASAGVDAQPHRRSRVQGSLSPHDAGLRRSRRSSGRFELVDDTHDRPGADAPKLSNEPRTSIADDDEHLVSHNGRSPDDPLTAPTSTFTQYDLPDESGRSSVDGGSLASSRVDHRTFRPSDSGSSHSSIGFAVQLALASGTRRRQKEDESDAARRWSQSRIAPVQADSAAGVKRGLLSKSRKDSPDDGAINDTAESYSRRYSSDSSVSVDGHLNYLVSMTATTGEALPLPLHLPPRVFGVVDMSKPPAPMQLTGIAGSSSSSTPSEPADRGSQQAINSRSRKFRDDRPRSEHSYESDDDNRPGVPSQSSRSSSPRSSWSGSESTNEVYARLQAMKLRALPAAPLREVDMSQPPAPAEGFFGHSSSSNDEKKDASEEGSVAEASHAGSVHRQPREEPDSQQPHRSSWSEREKSDDVFEKLEAMKLHRLPAPSFSKGFDMSQPPAPISDAFEKHSRSSMSSEVSSLGDDQVADPRLSPRSNESVDDVYTKLEALKLRALPAPPLQGLDMSKPPAPMDSLFKQYSIRSSSSDASGFSRRESHDGDGVGASSHDRRSLRDFEEEKKHPDDDFDSVNNASSASASPKPEARASRSAASLHIPFGDPSDSGGGASLADAFQRRHPRFHLRAEQHQQELERRRQQQLARQQQRQQQQQQQQSQTQQGGSKRGAARPSSAAPSSASADADAALSEEQQQLLDRLAAGARAKVSDKEMKERSHRLYQQLPEVVEHRRQEEVLRRRRERLNELREQEKVRRVNRLMRAAVSC